MAAVFALILAASPIVYDWWSKRVQLTLETKSIATVVSETLPIQNLELAYEGKKIKALNRLLLDFRNTGRTPITKDDVITPVTLTFNKGEVLEAKVVNVQPTNIDFRIEHSDNKITLIFSLLNPDENAKIDLLVSGSASYLASARIKNISEINVFYGEETHSSKNFAISSITNFLMGIIFIYFVIDVLKDVIATRKNTPNLKNSSHRIFSATTNNQAIEILYEDFKVLPKKLSVTTINKFDYPLNNVDKEEVKNFLIVQTSEENTNLNKALPFILVIGIIQIWSAFQFKDYFFNLIK